MTDEKKTSRDIGYRDNATNLVEKARLAHVNGVLDDAVRNRPIVHQCGNLLGLSTLDALLLENGFDEKNSLNGAWKSGHVLYYMRRRSDEVGRPVIDLLSEHDVRTGKGGSCYYEGLPYESVDDLVKAVEDGDAFCRGSAYHLGRGASAVAGLGYGGFNAVFASSASTSTGTVLYALTSLSFLGVSGRMLYGEAKRYLNRHKPTSVGTKDDPLAPIREALKTPYQTSVKVRVAPVEIEAPAAEPAFVEVGENAPAERKGRA